MAWTEPKTDFNPGDVLNAAEMNAIGEDLNALTGARRLGFETRTTNYSANQTALASASNVFSGSITWTADGTSTYWVQFFSPRVVMPNNSGTFFTLNLVDGSGGALGMAALVLNNSSIGMQNPLSVRVPYTPAAGSRTVNFRAVKNGTGDPTIQAGSGGSGLTDAFPMWLAVYGPETTNA
jgi:hypothetical protein